MLGAILHNTNFSEVKTLCLEDTKGNKQMKHPEMYKDPNQPVINIPFFTNDGFKYLPFLDVERLDEEHIQTMKVVQRKGNCVYLRLYIDGYKPFNLSANKNTGLVFNGAGGKGTGISHSSRKVAKCSFNGNMLTILIGNHNCQFQYKK